MPPVKDLAICVRHWDWSETSQTVSLLTAEHGILRGLAKGSRRERSPFSGGIELLTRGEAVFILKPSAGDVSPLATVTAWDLQEPFTSLRGRLDRLHAAMLLADLVHHALHDHDPHAGVFRSLDRSLGWLADGRPWARVVLGFLWDLLSETGYRPEIWNDPRRGVVIEPRAVYLFSPRLGGLIAEGPGDSRTPSPGAAALAGEAGSGRAGDETWKVRSDTVAVLRSVAAGSDWMDLEDASADTRIPDDAVVRCTALLASYFRFIHRSWPASIRWVLPDLASRARP